MSPVTVIHVGNQKERYFRDAEAEYIRRMRPLCDYRTVCVREADTRGESSEKLINRALAEEAAVIRSVIPPRSMTVAMCIEGKQFDSVEFSDVLAASERPICFIIGSSFGLDDELKKQCDMRVSFSKMTFPHMLARVILAEQVYRACMIASNRKYHK